MMIWIAALLQDTTAESELRTALRATVDKGFTYVIQPAASLADGFPQGPAALAGVVVKGKYRGGTSHAEDGQYEIVRRGSRVAVRTPTGWLPLDQFTSPLRQEVVQAFDPDDNRRFARGNVTAGRKALQELVRIAHLVDRADVDKLLALDRSFVELKRLPKAQIDGKAAVGYEGDLTDTAAFELLQGPFDELVRRGTLSFRDMAGVGRIYLRDGLVRRVQLKAGGAFGHYDDDENVSRKGVCALEVRADFTKIGETEVELPKDVEQILEK